MPIVKSRLGGVHNVLKQRVRNGIVPTAGALGDPFRNVINILNVIGRGYKPRPALLHNL